MSLERIEITPVATIIGDIVSLRKTGSLTILRQSMRKICFWSQGELVLVVSSEAEQSLSALLYEKKLVTTDQAVLISPDDPIETVPKFNGSGLKDQGWRNAQLREWTSQLFLPLFNLEDGTAVFQSENAIDPSRRVFVQSTHALVLEGIRSMTNGLNIRRALGEMSREIGLTPEALTLIDQSPLSEAERQMVKSVGEGETIDSFVRRFPGDSLGAAKVAIGMLATGIFQIVERRDHSPRPIEEDPTRDLALLAAIGPNDQRSLKAVAFSRQLHAIDYYQVIDVPRAATRAQIQKHYEDTKVRFDPKTYPPVVADAISAINQKIEEAWSVLRDSTRRPEYDRAIAKHGTRGDRHAVQQKVAQRSIAEQNYNRASELALLGDYYGAIVLLKQAVEYAPDHKDAWFLLASCEERNPKWRRTAATSYQKVLEIDPNHIDTMIALGDLYKVEGMIARSQAYFEDILQIEPENALAKSRLKGLKGR